jgi:pimeloyl-ACP methyl ester carboxylesterase
MPDFDNNGATIHYELIGSGSPLLLLPGITSDGASWALVNPLLADRHRLILVHNRGTGQTRHEGAITIADMITDYLALFDRLGIAKADIVGHSMGGMVGLRFAAAHPDRINRLVTVTTSLAPNGMQMLLFEDMAQLYEELPPQRWFALLFQWLFSDRFFADAAKVAEAAEGAAAYPYRQLPADFARQVEALKAMPPVDPTSILCPVLAIGAEFDILIPAREVEAAHQSIPNHRYEVIPRAAHSLPIEAPEALAKLIREFLR